LPAERKKGEGSVRKGTPILPLEKGPAREGKNRKTGHPDALSLGTRGKSIHDPNSKGKTRKEIAEKRASHKNLCAHPDPVDRAS